MDSTTNSPGRELATQQLHARQLLMQNQSTWPAYHVHNDALGQHHFFQTIDQQLYVLAQQLKWAIPDELPEVEICPVTNIPILGSFTPDLTDPSSECLKRARK